MLRPTFGKGDDKSFDANKLYTAQSDGWLIVMSCGPNADDSIEVLTFDDKTRAQPIDKLNARAQCRKYGSATMPVRRGESWFVRANRADPKKNGTNIIWFPVEFSPVPLEDK